MENPLVSVICLCYNQARYVLEALDSVIQQSYPAIQLIIVDDASSDQSKEEIKKWLKDHSEIPFVDLEENGGNTSAFNRGLKLAKGKYVVDLAADDVLMPERIEKQVVFFEQLDTQVGVVYSDVEYINERGASLGVHFNNHRMVSYEGNVYERVIDTYFIPPPSMMMKKMVLEELGGYDEELAYEDFDFWIRSARNWDYAYQPEVLTQVRKIEHSHSTSFNDKSDGKTFSTLKICRKLKHLNKSKAEDEALNRRIKYEIRQAFLSGKRNELEGFFIFWQENFKVPFMYQFIRYFGKLGANFNWLRRLKQQILGR